MSLWAGVLIDLACMWVVLGLAAWVMAMTVNRYWSRFDLMNYLALGYCVVLGPVALVLLVRK